MAGDDLGTVQGWNQISSRAMKLLGAPVGGILAAHTVADPATLRPVDAPWPDRPTTFARRKGH